MGLFDQLGDVAKNSRRLLQKKVEDYVRVEPPDRLTLKVKIVNLLCQKTVQRVDKLTTLAPDPQQGLLATIEQNSIQVKIHFTPEKICIKGDLIEGQLRLLQKPEVESSSPIYRTLLTGWSTFLGGYVPNQVFPEGVRLEGDRVYYSFPKGQLRLVDVLFHNLKDGSALNLDLQQGELHIQSTAGIHWRDINVLSLLQLLTAISSQKP